MRVVIDIPDETFIVGKEIHQRSRTARYLRRVSEDIEAVRDLSGTVVLSAVVDLAHTAGWAIEGAPWQRIDNEKEICT